MTIYTKSEHIIEHLFKISRILLEGAVPRALSDPVVASLGTVCGVGAESPQAAAATAVRVGEAPFVSLQTVAAHWKEEKRLVVRIKL